MSTCELALDRYLVEFRQKSSGCNPKEISMISLNKDSHVLEVPESVKVRKGGINIGSESIVCVALDMTLQSTPFLYHTTGPSEL